MRSLILALAVASAFGGTAAAQYPSTPYQVGMTQEVTPLGRLSAVSLDWIVHETARQALNPTTLETLDDNIEKAIGDDLEETAKREKLSKADMASALRYEILREAHKVMQLELRDRKKTARTDKSDEAMLSVQAAVSKEAKLKVLAREARKSLTSKARSIVN